MHLLRRRLSAAIYRIIFTTLIGFLFVGAADAMADTGHNLKIITLSSRPDTVSGGSVLVRVTLPPDVPANDVLVLLNSEDVTNAFRPEVGHSSLLGLLDGLTLGQNKLIVEALTKPNQVYRFASLDLTNSPITGPIYLVALGQRLDNQLVLTEGEPVEQTEQRAVPNFRSERIGDVLAVEQHEHIVGRHIGRQSDTDEDTAAAHRVGA